ncbi:MAG: HD domain-containing protein [Bacilli bacterium]
MLKEFKKYVNTFDLSIKEIDVKYNHSLRVMNLCVNIARSLNLNTSDVTLAKEIGLLHDYARFIQWKKYKTFNDKTSFDHGNKAVELLFNNEDIIKYKVKLTHYDIIKKAIYYHNKYKIDKPLNKKDLMFCNIVRDADKIDILEIFINNIYNNVSTSYNVNNDIKEMFFNHKPILIKRKLTPAEAHITRMAFIYDMNFKYSFNYIKETKLLLRYKTYLNDKQYDIYFNEINKFMEDK